MERGNTRTIAGGQRFALHGWVGISLIIIFWILNWGLQGLRTYWVFFPLWLGFCLTVDALVLYRTGTSLLTRSWQRYIGLFLLSAPTWWIFEAINTRLQNWHYVGAENFTPFVFSLWATLSFTTVIPAVFGAAELAASFEILRRLPRLIAIRPTTYTILGFFIVGLVSFTLMILYPHIFFPFIWLSIFFILEPINIWLGFPSLTRWLMERDWRPVFALWIGVIITAFFWEMWNFFSYPKWVYTVPWGGWLHIFEMPALGYLGYLPFALELFALYNLVNGILGNREGGYLHIHPEET